MPLHIFEERYKRMIGHCLESEEPFGIVLRDDDGSARRIGCTARVTEVLERFDDGRMDIIVTGEEPFRVLERRSEEHKSELQSPCNLVCLLLLYLYNSTYIHPVTTYDCH